MDQEQDMNGTEEVSISFNVVTFKENIIDTLLELP